MMAVNDSLDRRRSKVEGFGEALVKEEMQTRLL
jgi:hypothetical protein